MVTKEWFFKNVSHIEKGIISCGTLKCFDCPFHDSKVRKCYSDIIIKEYQEYKRIKKNLEQW